MSSQAVDSLVRNNPPRYTKAHEEGFVLPGVGSWIAYLLTSVAECTTIHYNRAVSTPAAC